MRQKFGIDEELEEEANRLMNLSAITSHEEKSDILTPWKDYERHRHEVYSGVRDPSDEKLDGLQQGAPERHNRLGMFHRASNLGRYDLNSRDGMAGLTRRRVPVRCGWDPGMTTLPLDVRGMTMTLEAWQRGEHDA